MAFADPQVVTVNSVDKTMNRVPSPVGSGKFSVNGGEFALEIVQSTTKERFNRAYRFTQTKIAADPISAVNKQVSATVTISVNEPRWGFSDAELTHLVVGLCSALQASSNADLVKLLEGEV